LVDIERRNWSNELKNVMDKAALDPIERKKSICYRCADAMESRFCRAWDRETDQTDPKDEGFLNPAPELDYDPYKSVIAVPIIVIRRLFGVLEIAGFSPYQFRFANLNLAQHVANVLGAFLHHKEMLRALHSLSMIILDHRLPDKEKYDYICKEFAKIFFADASVLFMAPPGIRGTYRLAGWHNREYLDQLSEKELNACILTEEREDSPLMVTLRTGEWHSIKMIKELEKRYPGWTNSFISRRDLNSFDWQVAIPVRTPRGIGEKEKKSNIGGLYLYYRNHPKEVNRPLLEGWELTVNFLADYVALLVEAMERKKKMLESHMIQHMLRHELRQTVISVVQRANDIVRFIRRHSQKLPKYLNDEIHLKYKDLSSSQMVLGEMVDMLQAESFEKLISHGLDPILYLISREGEIDLTDTADDINIKTLFYGLWKNIMKNKEYFAKKISYTFICQELAPSINANTKLVRLIFENLFNNAAKYSLKGSLIEGRIEKTKYSLIIHLTNEAQSLTSGEEDSIFEYGYRGSNTGKKKGDGLGLTVARRLCEVLNGTLKLEIKKIDKENSLFDFMVVLPKTILS
jgi:signal transduction histidine kinase